MASADVQGSKKSLLSKHLKQITDKNHITEQSRKAAVKRYKDVLDRLLESMKRVDELFKDMYQRLLYVGSYFDGLRVTEPTEFDIDVILKLPFQRSEVEVVLSKHQGYAEYKLKDEVAKLLGNKGEKWEKVYQQLVKWFENGKLSRKALQGWFHSVITRGYDALTPEDKQIIKMKKSGPAFTLQLLDTQPQVDVDLVPTLEFKGEWPPKAKTFDNMVTKEKVGFLLIPKPPRKEETNQTLFRIALSEVEKDILRNKGCIKELIKLFKILRDKQGWSKIASYHIKMMFVSELVKHNNATYWEEKNLGDLFITMLDLFHKALEQKKLQLIFYPTLNLFEDINPDTLGNYTGRVAALIKDIEKDYALVMRYYRNIKKQRTGKKRKLVKYGRNVKLPW